MAQLRDAQTSELIAEGEPRDLIVIADELGAGRVLWDGVGAIDLDAVRQVNADRLENLPADAAELELARQRAAAELAAAVDDVLESAQADRPTLEPVDVAAALEDTAG